MVMPNNIKNVNIAIFNDQFQKIKNGSAGFIGRLESMLSGTKDGKVNKAESQEAYDALLAQAGDQIPQEIKDRFKDGQAFADQFEQIDALGVADGYVDEEEFAKFLSPETEASPSESSPEDLPSPDSEA